MCSKKINIKTNKEKKIAIVTVTTRNYIHRVRTLFDSVTNYLPNARKIACCADDIESYFDPQKESFEIIEAKKIKVPRFDQLAFSLNATALCCCLKPFVISEAFKDSTIKSVLYIDNDVSLYRCPKEILKVLKTANCVLTPHHLNPLPKDAIPDEKTLSCYGTYNAGVIGFKKSKESNKFLEWWKEKLNDPRNLIQWMGYDQIWLNYAPVFCKKTYILADPSYNVAFWNLSERKIKKAKGDKIVCKNKKLTMFHFSNINEDHPNHLFWPSNFGNYKPTKPVKKILTDVLKRWKAAGRDECIKWGYGYNSSSWIVSRNQENQKALSELWDNIPQKTNMWTKKPLKNEKKIIQKIQELKKIKIINKGKKRIPQIIKTFVYLFSRTKE